MSGASYDALENLTVDLSSTPDVSFFRVEAIVRPWRAPKIAQVLSSRGVKGMTISDVRGAGVQGGFRERYAGTEFGSAEHFLVDKTRIEVVTRRSQVDLVVRAIATAAFTGEVGDGKIFVSPVLDVVRIRTAETGSTAEHMKGGMTDMLAQGSLQA